MKEPRIHALALVNLFQLKKDGLKSIFFQGNVCYVKIKGGQYYCERVKSIKGYNKMTGICH